MKTKSIAAAIAFTLLAMNMAAVAQTSSIPDSSIPDVKRLRFVDENGVEIESYCVAPLYSKGITKPFRLVTQGDGKLYLTAPVLLKEGDGGFYLNWSKRIEHSSIKLRRSRFGTNESMMPNTLLLLKAGRAPFVTSFYTHRNETTTVVFPKGDSNAAIELLTSDIVDIDAIRTLYGDQMDGYIRYGHRGMPLVYSYTKEEKELLRQCYKK